MAVFARTKIDSVAVELNLGWAAGILVGAKTIFVEVKIIFIAAEIDLVAVEMIM